MNPYPSNRQLQVESEAKRYVKQTKDNIAALQTALAIFVSIRDSFEWPIGFTVKGYDIEDVSVDSLEPYDDDEIWDRAMDKAGALV